MPALTNKVGSDSMRLKWTEIQKMLIFPTVVAKLIGTPIFLNGPCKLKRQYHSYPLCPSNHSPLKIKLRLK